jgi:hypothetical protein
MPKSRSRYARAQARARYRKPKRRGGSFGWNAGIALIAVLGIALLVWTVASRRTEAVAAPRAGDPTTGEAGDHWHASLDVYQCIDWVTTRGPEFESKADNPDVRVGIHSHGDGLIHIHPFNSSESGSNATVGRYMDYAGFSVSSSSFELWEGADGNTVQQKNGDECTMPDGSKQKGTLTWYVNGKKRSGDPADYKPKDDDQIVLVFAPEGTTLESIQAEKGPPPNSQQLQAPTDEAPYSTAPSTPAPGNVPELPAPSAPPSS